MKASVLFPIYFHGIMLLLLVTSSSQTSVKMAPSPHSRFSFPWRTLATEYNIHWVQYIPICFLLCSIAKAQTPWAWAVFHLLLLPRCTEEGKVGHGFNFWLNQDVGGRGCLINESVRKKVAWHVGIREIVRGSKINWRRENAEDCELKYCLEHQVKS